MTIASQLYSLQEFDLALDEIDLQKTKAEEELTVGVALERLESTLQAERESLEGIRTLHREEQPAEEVQDHGVCHEVQEVE